MLAVSGIRPFALTPSLSGGTLSPGGFQTQHLPLSSNPRPTHSKSQRAFGLAFLNKGHPHTPAERVRGHHPSRDTQSGHGGTPAGIAFLYNAAKEKMFMLRLTEKQAQRENKAFLSCRFELSLKDIKTRLFLFKSLLLECLLRTRHYVSFSKHFPFSFSQVVASGRFVM